MKKPPLHSSRRRRTAACTVSAAALMLGVSHAATVGINFTVNYNCCTGNYVNYVNVPAFGIPASGWQNLSATGVGYGDAGCPLFYNITNVIDTTAYVPVGGFTNLNPLPNGSVTVSWFAPTANWSGFAGYDSGHANQPRPSSGPPRGEAEVYAGFLRDGVNWGPHDASCAGGPDNTAGLPGYSVDIVGLKSLFTNTPFVIQLVAATDSMNTLTNAFIIDASHSSTQSVVYPNPQHYGNAGGAPWFRAIGGGLSTVSTTVDADHVKIIGNKAQHGGSIADGDDYNNASCIAGFIITDKPVVTMSPQPVIAAPHDIVHLRGIAAGVPPLAYQWRLGGVPIPGATTNSYTIPNIASGGDYDMVVTNLYGSATSSVSTVSLDKVDIKYDGTNAIVSWKYRDPTLVLLGSSDPTLPLASWTTVAGDGDSPVTAPITTDTQYYIYSHTGPNEFNSNPYDQ